MPKLHPGDVLVKVLAAGVCGTDVRIYKGEHRAAHVGLVPGHEIIGRVAEAAGALPTGIEAGDVVMVAPNIGCGICRWCCRGQENLCPRTEALGITMDGGFAEFLAVPARAAARGNLIPLGSAGVGRSAEAYLPYVMAEPLACVVRGQRRLGLVPGETVVVCGAGPVGLAHVALARASGARVLCSEPAAARREAALRAGADSVSDADEPLDVFVSRETGSDGVDAVITAAPVAGLQALALEAAAPRGRVLFFAGLPKRAAAVEIPTNELHYKELTIMGTSASTLDDCRWAVHLIGSGVVDTSWMVSQMIDLVRFEDAISAVQDRSALKVAVIPDHGPSAGAVDATGGHRALGLSAEVGSSGEGMAP
jgi:L-iditol 2-dehydrogenase